MISATACNTVHIRQSTAHSSCDKISRSSLPLAYSLIQIRSLTARAADSFSDILVQFGFCACHNTYESINCGFEGSNNIVSVRHVFSNQSYHLRYARAHPQSKNSEIKRKHGDGHVSVISIALYQSLLKNKTRAPCSSQVLARLNVSAFVLSLYVHLISLSPRCPCITSMLSVAQLTHTNHSDKHFDKS